MQLRAHRVRAHRSNMIALYVGALVITGLFTLLPGRLIGSIRIGVRPWQGGSPKGQPAISGTPLRACTKTMPTTPA